jgi:predicted amidohydrolase
MFRTASVQASSVWLDRAATTEKVCALIGEAGRGGAQIVALPESFVPGFPYRPFTMKLADATGYLGKYRKLVPTCAEREGRMYNVVAQEFGTPEVYEAVGVEYNPDVWNRISGTIGPDGNWTRSLRDEEGIVYAGCDPGATIDGRLFHDIVGHYDRFDVLQLHVGRSSRGPVAS